MIIEGLLTTTNQNGTAHIAPMGPVVDEQLQDWLLRPFDSSTSFRNLQRTGLGVFHVVDDVLPVVQAALGQQVDLAVAKLEEGLWLIPSACHWYALQMLEWNTNQPRAEVRAQVIRTNVIRPFWGWNRAKHAVLEAAIMATRLQLIGPELVRDELDRLAVAVEKTAGPREKTAWSLVCDYVRCWQQGR